MKSNSHKIVTELAFSLLKEVYGNFPLNWDFESTKNLVATYNVLTDNSLYMRDLEFIDVEGGITGHGRDDPHKDEWDAIDDIPHYVESRFFGYFYYELTAFNHFIDIKKGSGEFDDYDGYSYRKGSASKEQYEKIIGLEEVDAFINWWLNDEYIHAPGHRWYQGCSPSVERYSYYNDKGNYGNYEDEAQARFPRAKSTGEEGRGIPYSVFMPVDNMARYWFSRFRTTREASDLGPVMHAIQDASVPHHASGYCGNWHGKYEEHLDAKILYDYRNPAFYEGFKNTIINYFNNWNSFDSSPPDKLNINEYSKVPKRNWKTEWLVTWIALNAHNEYANTYNNFKDYSSFVANENSIKDLAQKATAMTMLILKEAMVCSLKRSYPFDYNSLELKQKDDGLWQLKYRTGFGYEMILKEFSKKEEAERALEIIKHYKMNNHVEFGVPTKLMEYFLVDGEVPLNLVDGEQSILFYPEELEVIYTPDLQFIEAIPIARADISVARTLSPEEKIRDFESADHSRMTTRTHRFLSPGSLKSSWKIVKPNGEIIKSFGNCEFEAIVALEIIQDYKFDHYCYIGEKNNPSMEYFRKSDRLIRPIAAQPISELRRGVRTEPPRILGTDNL